MKETKDWIQDKISSTKLKYGDKLHVNTLKYRTQINTLRFLLSTAQMRKLTRAKSRAKQRTCKASGLSRARHVRLVRKNKFQF